MKWTRAVHHLEALAQKCAEMATMPASIQPLRVVQLWAIGDILGEPRDLESVHVALAVDLPVDTVPVAQRAVRVPALGQRHQAQQEPDQAILAVGARSHLERAAGCVGTAEPHDVRREMNAARPSR